MKPIGQTFSDELAVSGLLGLPFSWSEDGIITFSDAITSEQRVAVMAVYDAHDPDAVPVPAFYSCTPWQIRKALNSSGLRAGVEAAIAASTDQALKDGWEFATEFKSDDPFVLQMGAALGKSPEETEALIQMAATL